MFIYVFLRSGWKFPLSPFYSELDFFLSYDILILFIFVLLQLFFVLRKKNSQVSTLHVIHHGCMPMSVWFGVKFTPGMRGYPYFIFYYQLRTMQINLIKFYANPLRFGSLLFDTSYVIRWSQHFLRTFEHLCAHCYVLILLVRCYGTTIPEIPLVEEIFDRSANGKQCEYLLIDKHNCRNINQYNIFRFIKWFFVQIQFVAIMVHAFQLLFIDCNYPKAFVWWIGMHAVMFFFLFNEFYKSTYKANMEVKHFIFFFRKS